jgi:hypothetical protein
LDVNADGVEEGTLDGRRLKAAVGFSERRVDVVGDEVGSENGAEEEGTKLVKVLGTTEEVIDGSLLSVVDGFADGVIDGELLVTVGTEEGPLLGCLEGRDNELIEGVGPGKKVGRPLAERLGIPLATSEGRNDGTLLTASVGCEEGELESASDGLLDGSNEGT